MKLGASACSAHSDGRALERQDEPQGALVGGLEVGHPEARLALLHPTPPQHSTAQHSTAQHSTAQHSTAQHSTAQHSTAQHSTGAAQHRRSTAQHSTAQVSPAQHSKASDPSPSLAEAPTTRPAAAGPRSHHPHHPARCTCSAGASARCRCSWPGLRRTHLQVLAGGRPCGAPRAKVQGYMEATVAGRPWYSVWVRPARYFVGVLGAGPRRRRRPCSARISAPTAWAPGCAATEFPVQASRGTQGRKRPCRACAQGRGGGGGAHTPAAEGHSERVLDPARCGSA